MRPEARTSVLSRAHDRDDASGLEKVRPLGEPGRSCRSPPPARQILGRLAEDCGDASSYAPAAAAEIDRVWGERAPRKIGRAQHGCLRARDATIRSRASCARSQRSPVTDTRACDLLGGWSKPPCGPAPPASLCLRHGSGPRSARPFGADRSACPSGGWMNARSLDLVWMSPAIDTTIGSVLGRNRRERRPFCRLITAEPPGPQPQNSSGL